LRVGPVSVPKTRLFYDRIHEWAVDFLLNSDTSLGVDDRQGDLVKLSADEIRSYCASAGRK
jgi:hypothetical protein